MSEFWKMRSSFHVVLCFLILGSASQFGEASDGFVRVSPEFSQLFDGGPLSNLHSAKQRMILERARHGFTWMGISEGAVDAEKMRDSLLAFQSENGLPETGKLDEQTCSHLGLEGDSVGEIPWLRFLGHWKLLVLDREAEQKWNEKFKIEKFTFGNEVIPEKTHEETLEIEIVCDDGLVKVARYTEIDDHESSVSKWGSSLAGGERHRNESHYSELGEKNFRRETTVKGSRGNESRSGAMNEASVMQCESIYDAVDDVLHFHVKLEPFSVVKDPTGSTSLADWAKVPSKRFFIMMVDPSLEVMILHSCSRNGTNDYDLQRWLKRTEETLAEIKKGGLYPPNHFFRMNTNQQLFLIRSEE